MRAFVRSFPALALVLFATSAGAEVIDVPADHGTIAAALAAAAPGDTVRVTCGTYFERLALPAGVTLLGELPSAPPCVTIDGGAAGRVIDCNGVTGVTIANIAIQGGSLEGTTARGGGVRIVNGASVRLERCRIEGNRAMAGAGISVESSTVELVDCQVEDNQAAVGWWVHGAGLHAKDAAGSVTGCTFRANVAAGPTAPDLPGDGGGAFCDNTTLVFADCLFHENVAGAGAGAFYSYNGDDSDLADCTFLANHAPYGGGAYLEQGSRARFVGCLFTGNVAQQGGALQQNRRDVDCFNEFIDCRFTGHSVPWGGGAIIATESADGLLRLTRCVLDHNHAQEGGAVQSRANHTELVDCVLSDNDAARGGAVYVFGAPVALDSCTLAYNAASAVGGGAALWVHGETSATLDRCLLAFGTAGAAAGGAGAVTASCTDVWGHVGGDWTGPLAGQAALRDNLAADPMFCDGAARDLALHADSPCAAANNPQCGRIGALEVACGAPIGVGDQPAPAGAVQVGAAPNPFNPATTIRYVVPAPGPVRVTVHDATGALVRELVDAPCAAGAHLSRWDGRDARGRAAAAGVYHCLVEGGGRRATVKLVLVR